MESRFPATVTAQATLNNHVTDLVIADYANKIFISVTQFGKIGSLVLVRRDVNLNEDSSPVYSVKSLLGIDQPEYHILARHLFERLQLKKQLLFGFALHSFTKKDLGEIEDFICVIYVTLRSATWVRYDHRRHHVKTYSRDEIKEKGLEYEPTSLEEEYEKMIQSESLSQWEQKRVPRPWKEEPDRP